MSFDDPDLDSLDLLFLIDATSSTKCVIRGIRAQCFDTTRDIHDRYANVDVHFGVVAYRDPVDNPDDQHDVLDFTPSAERLQDFLASVKSYGGRDDCEDIAGGLELALSLAWRPDAKKCLFLVTDANAHGGRFSGLDPDPHEDQTPRLEDFVRQLARRRVYVNAINIRKGGDAGAERTLDAFSEIYAEEGGPVLQISTFAPRFAWQVEGGEPSPAAPQPEFDSDDEIPAIDEADDEGGGDDEMWAPDSLNILRTTLHSQLLSSFVANPV
jgi:hypothetical protein